jgi:hypothetical protein
MGRWRVIIDAVIQDMEPAMGDRPRTERDPMSVIGKAIFDGEDMAVNHMDPVDNETPAERKREFQAALRAEFQKRLAAAEDLSKQQSWEEAITLLDDPMRRFPEHR